MSALRNLTVLAAAACVVTAFAQTPMEPGNWHITTKSTTKGKADPVQEQDECLRDELKDLATYFAPALEGVQSECKKTPQPSRDKNVIAYKMKCTGAGFTMDAESSVKVEGPKRFTVRMKMDTRTPKERAVVVAAAEAVHTGPCKEK